MIDTLRLRDFRSYKDSSFEFSPGVNIVVGPNASGKTNLLEAILVLASGKSFRVSNSELIRFRAPWARLDGFFGANNRVVKLTLEEDRANKEYVLDNKAFKRLNLERSLPVVLFEPNHLQLIIRGPQTRRDYFDDILERTQLGYKSLLASYLRTLAQRNALLKQPRSVAKKQLFAWDIRLSELGGQIARARSQLVGQINKALPKSYNKIAGKRSKIRLEYETQFDMASYSSKLLSNLESSLPLDLKRGFTAHGPHREDITVYLKDQPAATSASRGETRSLILALKIFELGLIEKTRKAKPIFLLDDVFSELDGSRRRHLVESLKDTQTIITTTDADAVVEYFAQDHKLIALG